jgi:hypothetical protein
LVAASPIRRHKTVIQLQQQHQSTATTTEDSKNKKASRKKMTKKKRLPPDDDASDAAARQAILAQLTSKASLVLKVAVGILFLVDAVQSTAQLFFGTRSNYNN